MDYGAFDGVVFVVSLVMLLVKVTYILCKVCSTQALEACRGAVVAALHWMRKAKPKEPSEIEIEAAVAAKLQKQKIARCVRTSQVTWILCSCQVLQMLESIAFKRTRYLTATQDVCFLAIYACISVLPHAPIPERIMVDFYYSVMMALGALFVSPIAMSKASIIQLMGSANIGMLILTVWQPSMVVSAFWTSCLVCSICSCMVANAPLDGIPDVNEVVIFEGILGIAAFMLGRLLEASMRSEMRAIVENEATREVHKAACALLRSFSDVVVDVDNEGRVISNGDGLGGFLLRGRGLQGSRISDLLSDEENKDAVLRKFQTPSQEGALMADIIHVHMRDGNGATIAMELFCFNYRGVECQTRSMVGLREFGDAGPDGVPFRRRALGDSPHEQVGAADDAMGESEVYVVVHTGSPGLPIQEASTGFGLNIDRVPLQYPLLKLCSNGAKFLSWVQNQVNDQMLQEESSSCPTRCFRVGMQTRTGRKMATVKLLMFEDSDDEEEKEDEEEEEEEEEKEEAVKRDSKSMWARLTFTDIAHKTAQGKKSITALEHRAADETSSSGSDRQRLGTKRQPAPESSGSLSRTPPRSPVKIMSI